MKFLAGENETAEALAEAVFEKAQIESRSLKRKERYWALATMGEACLILGRKDEAFDYYAEAVSLAGTDISNVEAMRRNLLLLREKIDIDDELLAVCDIGRVIVFSGHMTDHPDRAVPRFPAIPKLERMVGAAIAEELEDVDAMIGYSSAACGSDILFAEQMIKRGAELHIVLPFDKEDFVETSVTCGCDENRRWLTRYRKVLSNATEIHYATKEKYLNDQILFEFMNTVTQGLAIRRARDLGVEPVAIVVMESEAKRIVGGTKYLSERWKRSGHEIRKIDLSAIRSRTLGNDNLQPKISRKPRTAREREVSRRKVKIMLFADVKNFSSLKEEQTPLFFSGFLTLVSDLVNELKRKRKVNFLNTWGDGLYMVFDDVIDCATFALKLLHRVEQTDFKKLKLPEDTTVRVGIHAGPVFELRDPIIHRRNYYGSHVNRAARIEPVTPPGCVYTSEQVAALLAVLGSREIDCEFVGLETLAKEYDRCALYRIFNR